MECFLFAFGSVSNQLYSLTGFQVLYGYGSEARYLLHLHKRCQYRCPQSVRFGLQSQICLTSLFHMLWLLLFYIVAIMPDIQLLTSCYNRFFIYFGLAVVLYIFFNSLLPQRARSATGFFIADYSLTPLTSLTPTLLPISVAISVTVLLAIAVLAVFAILAIAVVVAVLAFVHVYVV